MAWTFITCVMSERSSLMEGALLKRTGCTRDIASGFTGGHVDKIRRSSSRSGPAGEVIRGHHPREPMTAHIGTCSSGIEGRSQLSRPSRPLVNDTSRRLIPVAQFLVIARNNSGPLQTLGAKLRPRPLGVVGSHYGRGSPCNRLLPFWGESVGRQL